MATLQSIQLKFYREDEIRKFVVRVTNASTYDRGIPRLQGVNDPRLGLTHQTAKCPTCAKVNCDQHLGYIQLAKPVYKIGTINYALQVLRCVCRNCAEPKFWFRNASWQNHDLKANVNSILQDNPTSKDKLRLISELCRNKFICSKCGLPQPNYIKRDRTFIEANYRSRDLIGTEPEFVEFVKHRFTPEEARAIFEAMHPDVLQILDLVHPEEMVIRLHIVPPPCIRPSNFVGETKVRSENDLTVAIQDLVRANCELETIVEANGTESQIQFAWDKLQIMAAGIVLHTIKKTIGTKLGLVPMLTATAKRKVIDIKTRLSGKKGRFRGNLSGKRVDQSGRSVIAPDSSHDITQLGVPNNIMNTLTFPEIVNERNMDKLSKAIIKGPYENGGAMAVRQPGAAADTVIWLPVLDREARIDLASQIAPLWTVERHLVDGDWVLFNRQPSLWKASMMAFRCYRVNTLCFRLPLPVTKPFNADFDGDEMNIHSLQSYEAIAEAQELLSVPQQMMTPQSNSIIIGLVQDSLVGGFRLTDKNTFLTRMVFENILMYQTYDPKQETYSDMMGPNQYVPKRVIPAILKAPGAPSGLYTGKQLVSNLLPQELNLKKSVRGSSTNVFDDDNDVVTIVNGEHLTGQMCKSVLGSTNNGLVQLIYKVYGSWAACKFVSDAQRVFVMALTYIGPSISILDCVISEDTEHKTKAIMNVNLQKAESLLHVKLPKEIIEAKSSSILQSTLRSIGGTVVETLNKKSGIFTVVTAGSKGNLMNIAQIAGTVGQQTVFGRRVPTRKSTLGFRTLACFEPNDASPQSRGFIEHSYMNGLSPSEFFYHQMAGREGIVATAVNTADSGYNQRRMVKSQESQCVAYDGSVRVASSFVLQRSYGFDDLDGSRICRFVLSDEIIDKARRSNHKILVYCANVLCRYFSYQSLLMKQIDFTVVCPIKQDTQQIQIDTVDVDFLFKSLIRFHCKLHNTTKWYVTVPLATTILVSWFHNIETDFVLEQYLKAMVHPGESVGALAATCIGEPSMQMTLNVFHYSGIASKNVTITGLPRFRQIINAIDTYETANMNAELNSYEETSLVNSAQYLQVFQIAKTEIKLISEMPKFLVCMLETMPRSAGHISQKAYKRKSLVGVKNPWVIQVNIDYDACERYNLFVNQISTAMFDLLGSEASVISWPHAAMKPIYVWPFLAEMDKQYVEAFSQAILQISIRGIEGVKRCIAQQELRYDKDNLQKRSVHTIDTEGSSLIQFGKLSFCKQETLITNNIVEAASVFGINAGVTVLQSELHKVLSFDSSYIDPRHTWLLADTMCRAGMVCAMNRHNMEHLGNSMLQRASFEQSLETLNEAAVFGREDQLKGATERIMVGQPANVGTGIVSIVKEMKEPAKQVMVRPMQRENQMQQEETVVMPLYRPSFQIDNFSVRVLDEDKDCNNFVLLQALSEWRTYAASQRIVAQIQIVQKISGLQARGVLAECRLYSWTQTFATRQFTEVYDNDNIVTTVSKQFDVKHSKRSVHFQGELFKDTLVSVVSDIALESIQGSRIPTCVIIKQEQMFQKCGFNLILCKEWKGSTNMEAEDKLLNEGPEYILKLEFSDAEQMLQARASNHQIASAFLKRLC